MTIEHIHTYSTSRLKRLQDKIISIVKNLQKKAQEKPISKPQKIHPSEALIPEPFKRKLTVPVVRHYEKLKSVKIRPKFFKSIPRELIYKSLTYLLAATIIAIIGFGIYMSLPSLFQF